MQCNLTRFSLISTPLLVFGVLALCLIVSRPVYGQVVGATVSGTVSDNSGAVIPNAQLSIKNVATGVIRTLTTDRAGFYTAPNISSGSYEVTVSAPGFKTAVQSGITLTVGAQQTLNFTLQVGTVSEKVEVTAEAPVVQLSSSAIGNLVGATTVVELPLNGRDWGSLANLEPGVAAVQVQLTTSANVAKAIRGFGNQMTIAGTRPQMNNYRLDGVSIVDYSGGSPGSVLGLTMGVDAVGEFSVITSNHSAEYGRTSGGVVNAITKSGTNLFHGDAYWFLRDEGFDARSATDAFHIPPFHRNQFGGSVGGPILKSKTFFFFNFEGLRQNRTSSAVDTVPSANARNGIISAASGGGAPLTSCAAGYTLPVPGTSNICVSTAVQPFLPFWAVPTAGQLIGSGDVGHIPLGITAVGDENFYTARIDHTISAHDSLSGSFFIDKASFSQPDPLFTMLNGNTSGRYMVTATETHIFNPSLINNLRIGYSRAHMIQGNPISVLNPLAADTSGPVSAVPGRPAPSIIVQGIQTFNGGLRALNLATHVWNSYQLYDDAFLTKGTHSMKFGFVVENMRHAPTSIQGVNAVWTFPGLVQFLQNQPSALREPAVSYAHPSLRQTLFGGYFQDDWRFRPNLTLNLGLRYEAATVMSEVTGDLMNLASPLSTTRVVGNPLYQNPTLRNFEPRVGFAWDPFHNGKTSVRGAFGIFDILPLISEFFASAAASPASAPPGLTLGQTSLPQGSFPKITNIAPGTAAVVNVTESHPKRNYVMVWNVSVQRQLTADTSVTIGYVGNRGVHMQNQFGEFTMAAPLGYTAAGFPFWPIPLGSGTQINPAARSGTLWDGDAHYHALEASVNKKFSHGFQLQGSYTWGRGTDTSSASVISDPFINSISTLYWFCKACRLGPSDFDITQKFVANFIWDLPTPKSLGAFASHVLGGWELGSIITATSGTPFTPLLGGDPEGTKSTNPPSDFPDRLTGSGCSSAINPGNVVNYIKLNCFGLPTAPAGSGIACTPFGAPSAPIAGTCANLQGNAGRNSLRGPGLFDVDFSVIKNTRITRISENFNIQFRVEMFNVLNHPSWQAPVDTNTLFSPTGAAIPGAGALDAVTVPGREIQFGLKFIF